MTKVLTYKTLDSNKETAYLEALIGTKLKHLGNDKMYIITGACWLGATDEWGYIYSEVRMDGRPTVTMARPLSHIYGKRSNGQHRYIVYRYIVFGHEQ